jgi:hypothetical protein
VAGKRRINRQRKAYQRIIDAGDADQAPQAAFLLGFLLEGHGEVSGAIAAYRQARASRHPEFASVAALNLGNVLVAMGDTDGARAAFQRRPTPGTPMRHYWRCSSSTGSARLLQVNAMSATRPTHAPARSARAATAVSGPTAAAE